MNDAILSVYNSGICNYLLSTENTVASIVLPQTCRMCFLMRIKWQILRPIRLQQSTASASLQFSPFHHNPSPKTKAKTSELAKGQKDTSVKTPWWKPWFTPCESAHTTWAGTHVGRLQTLNSHLTRWEHFPPFFFFSLGGGLLHYKMLLVFTEFMTSFSACSCLVVSDKLFSNSHLLHVKLAELSVSLSFDGKFCLYIENIRSHCWLE